MCGWHKTASPASYCTFGIQTLKPELETCLANRTTSKVESHFEPDDNLGNLAFFEKKRTPSASKETKTISGRRDNNLCSGLATFRMKTILVWRLCQQLSASRRNWLVCGAKLFSRSVRIPEAVVLLCLMGSCRETRSSGRRDSRKVRMIWWKFHIWLKPAWKSVFGVHERQDTALERQVLKPWNFGIMQEWKN